MKVLNSFISGFREYAYLLMLSALLLASCQTTQDLEVEWGPEALRLHSGGDECFPREGTLFHELTFDYLYRDEAGNDVFRFFLETQEFYTHGLMGELLGYELTFEGDHRSAQVEVWSSEEAPVPYDANFDGEVTTFCIEDLSALSDHYMTIFIGIPAAEREEEHVSGFFSANKQGETSDSSQAGSGSTSHMMQGQILDPPNPTTEEAPLTPTISGGLAIIDNLNPQVISGNPPGNQNYPLTATINGNTGSYIPSSLGSQF